MARKKMEIGQWEELHHQFICMRRILETMGCTVVCGPAELDLQNKIGFEDILVGLTVAEDGKPEPQVIVKYVDVHSMKSQTTIVKLANQAGFPYAVTVLKNDLESMVWFDAKMQVPVAVRPVFSSRKRFIADVETLKTLLANDFLDSIYMNDLGSIQLHLLADILLLKHYLNQQGKLDEWRELDYQKCCDLIYLAYKDYSIPGAPTICSENVKDVLESLLAGAEFFPPEYEHYNRCFASMIDIYGERRLGELSSTKPVQEMLVGLAELLLHENTMLVDPTMGIGFTFFELIKKNKFCEGVGLESKQNLCKVTQIISIISGLASRVTIQCDDSLAVKTWAKNTDLVVFDPPLGKRAERKLPDDSVLFTDSKRNVVDTVELLIEKSIRTVRNGGHIVLLVPESILFASQTKVLRDHILDTCHVRAIISLPPGALRPVAGIKTSILILRKKAISEESGNVFLANLEALDAQSISEVINDFATAICEAKI